MNRGLFVLAVCLLGAVTLFLSAADTKPGDPKDPPPPPPKGQLPANWKKIGLTDEQVKKIYGVQADYHAKIAVLEEQVKALRAEQFKKEIELLTDAQKARLKELGEFKDPTAPPKDDPKKDPTKDDPKKDDPKKDDPKKDDPKKEDK
jgi:hypothetical protein